MKMDYATFKTLFQSKYGTHYTDGFITEAYNVYVESPQLDDTLDWVLTMMIGD